MTVPPRRAAPAFLQVDAVLAKLVGDQAIAEVARYLAQEFAHFRWVGIYRLDGELLRRVGASSEDAEAPAETGTGVGVVGRAAAHHAVERFDAPEGPSIAVPIDHAAALVGVIEVRGRSPGALDASDAAFLGAVAARLGAAVATSAGARLL